jgi:hypothetical protein
LLGVFVFNDSVAFFYGALDTIPTPNKEVVVVQMGDNQEAIATRKRMVERIKQDPSKG